MSLVFARVDLVRAQLHLPGVDRVMMVVHVVDAGEHDGDQRSPAASGLSTPASPPTDVVLVQPPPVPPTGNAGIGNLQYIGNSRVRSGARLHRAGTSQGL